MSTPRFLVGIDLGTTNSAVAYMDLQERGGPRLRLFHVPQLVAPGETAPRDTLPSFVFFPTDDDRRGVVGIYAREQGALLPTRQVSSAKSWLCHPDIDRAARILPWGAEEPVMSPVEASAAILRHIKNAWNETFAHAPDAGSTRHADCLLEHQDIVLTVPASFDQEARELTVEAARAAGLERLRLLEEPLAAFYAWISAHGQALPSFEDGDQVLVCDVGGGTSDFTLIRVRLENDEPAFERTAVGEHLLLGGDNLDLALARQLEQKLGDRALSLVQRLSLRRSASAAKERLLSDPSLDRVSIAVLGSGRALVGGSVTTDLTRQEVVEALADGFLPVVDANARPARDRRAALRELGLPYAEDAAITRHLAAFLAGAAGTQPDAVGPASLPAEAAEAASVPAKAASLPAEVPSVSAGQLARPDAILFNGGFFTPALARERVLENLRHWFGGNSPSPRRAGADVRSPGAEAGGRWEPRVLENDDPAAAVALGAAYYAFVLRRGGLRVRAGSSRTYYIGVGVSPNEAMCILPRGTEEGTSFTLADREFVVITNRPVAFPLFSSTVRQDALGTLVTLAGDDVHAHAPLATVLRYGKKTRQVELPVHLSAAFTETGTLEVSCASKSTEHRWRLRFQLRGEDIEVGTPRAGSPRPEAGFPPRGDRTTAGSENLPYQEPDAESLVPPERLAAAQDAIARTFAPGIETALDPTSLPAHLEAALGFGRQAWPLSVIRSLADALLKVAAGRKLGPKFEARWLNLLGFCLRPGFGAALDDWRVGQARGIYVEGLSFPKDLQCQVEWIVMWQRVAGGLKAGQQRELYQRYSTLLDVRAGKKVPRLNPQIQREAWRLLASLEHLTAPERGKLGDVLLDRLERDPDNASYPWAAGRFGARMPAHGPVTAVIPPDHAERWIERLLSIGAGRTGSPSRPRRGRLGDASLPSEIAEAIAQIGAVTNDPLRDIGENVRALAITRLTEAGFAREAEALREYQPPAARNALQLFGEELPVGLRIL